MPDNVGRRGEVPRVRLSKGVKVYVRCGGGNSVVVDHTTKLFPQIIRGSGERQGRQARRYFALKYPEQQVYRL